MEPEEIELEEERKFETIDRDELLAREGEPVVGFRETRKGIEDGEIETAVVATNCPDDFVSFLEDADVEVRSFDGDSRELGVAYGKPFNISVVGLTG